MKFKSAAAAALLVITTLLLAGCSSGGLSGGAGKSEPIQASGVIEVEQVSLAAELPGRIAAIRVEEGDPVTAGDLLVSLEDDLLRAQQAQAQAASQAATAQLDSAEAGLEAAQAYLESAQLSQEAAQLSLQLTLAQASQTSGNARVADWNQAAPDQFDLPTWYFEIPENIQAAQNQVDQTWDSYLEEMENYRKVVQDLGGEEFQAAEGSLANALAAYQIAQDLKDRPAGYTGRQAIRDVIDAVFDEAEADLEAAQDAFDQLLSDPENEEILDARARLTVARERYDLARDHLAAQYRGSFSLEIQLAENAVSQAEAGVRQAEAQLSVANTTKASASSALEGAQAALDLITLQLEKTQLLSPISGVVLTRSAQPGEVIGAGYTLLTIGDLSQLTVTVYLPEDRYGQISLGDKAELAVDSSPEETFPATVIWISDQAEYTPRNVQTQEERQNTVYAVKLAIQPSASLKPGMPADVVFTP